MSKRKFYLDSDSEDEDQGDLFDLPTELKLKIFEKLDRTSSHNLSQTSKFYKKMYDHFIYPNLKKTNKYFKKFNCLNRPRDMFAFSVYFAWYMENLSPYIGDASVSKWHLVSMEDDRREGIVIPNMELVHFSKRDIFKRTKNSFDEHFYFPDYFLWFFYDSNVIVSNHSLGSHIFQIDEFASMESPEVRKSKIKYVLSYLKKNFSILSASKNEQINYFIEKNYSSDNLNEEDQKMLDWINKNRHDIPLIRVS